MEKKRWQEQHESETEKRHREALEKEETKLKRLEDEKKAALVRVFLRLCLLKMIMK